MPTTHELRLARALEALSAHDMLRFIDWIGYQTGEANKMLLQRRALQWAEQTKKEAATPPE